MLIMMSCVFACSKKGEVEDIEGALELATKAEYAPYFEYLDNSFLDMPWFKEKVEESRALIVAGYPLLHERIYQCTYRDGIGFMLEFCVDCPDAGFTFVNANGVEICYSNGWVDTCKEFTIDLEGKKIIWEIQPDPPLTIENFYEQPLSMINKCVQGKWKLHKLWDGLDHYYFETFVEISEKGVTVSGSEGLNFTFTYGWKNMEVSPPYPDMNSYTTYVMWNDKQNKGEWSFYSLRGDMLVVNMFNSGAYTLIRIRDDKGVR